MKIEHWKNGVLISTVNAPDSAAIVKDELAAIDLASIRAMREYIAAKADAPQVLKDREAAAVALRAKLSGAV